MKSSHFTGMPPYVGWEGLGLALRQDYDMYDKKVADLEKVNGEILMSWENIAGKLADMDSKNKELKAAWDRVDDECTASNKTIHLLANMLRNILRLASKPNFTTLHEFVEAARDAEKLLDAVDADLKTK